jgi:ketosteroid isomerase-like protein
MMRKEEIIEIEKKLIEGIKTSDIKLLDKLLHDDLLFIAPNGQTVTKEMDLASHRAGEMEVEQLTATFEDIKIMGDNAVVVVVYDTRGKMLGNPIQGQFRYIRIWKMFTDGLKVIGGSCFKI